MSNTWKHNLQGPAETITVWLCFLLSPSAVYYFHMFIGLLLTHHVGLRQCGLMDGSLEVHWVQGDKHLFLTRSGADRWQSVFHLIRFFATFTCNYFRSVEQTGQIFVWNKLMCTINVSMWVFFFYQVKEIIRRRFHDFMHNTYSEKAIYKE